MPTQRQIRVKPDSALCEGNLIDINTGNSAFFANGDSVVFEITPFRDGAIAGEVSAGSINLEIKADSNPNTAPYLRASSTMLTPPSSVEAFSGGANTCEITIAPEETLKIATGYAFINIYWLNGTNKLTFFSGGINIKAGITAASVGTRTAIDINQLQLVSEKGQNNGYAGLDASGRLAAAQIPEGLGNSGNYLGTVEGNMLPASASHTGDWYYISTIGTSHLVTYAVGDRAVWGGSAWTRVPVVTTPRTSTTAVLDSDSFVTLRTVDATALNDGQLLYVKYHTSPDGDRYAGGGMFRLDKTNAAGATADDSGVSIAAMGVTNGYWVRVNTEIIYPEMFGAKGDWNGDLSMPTGTDNRGAFTEAIAFLRKNSKTGTLKLVSGASYLVKSSVALYKGIVVDGQNARIGYDGMANDTAFTVNDDSSVNAPALISNFNLQATSTTAVGLDIQAAQAILAGSYINGSSTGVKCSGDSVTVEASTFSDCAAYAIDSTSKSLSINNTVFESTNSSSGLDSTMQQTACVRATNSHVIASECVFSSNKAPSFLVNNDSDSGAGLELNGFFYNSEGTMSARNDIVENQGSKYIYIGKGSSAGSFFKNIVNNSSTSLTTAIFIESQISSNITARTNNVDSARLTDSQGGNKIILPEIEIQGGTNSFFQRVVTDGNKHYLSFQNDGSTEQMAIEQGGQTFIGLPHDNSATARTTISMPAMLRSSTSLTTGNTFEILNNTKTIFAVNSDGHIVAGGSTPVNPTPHPQPTPVSAFSYTLTPTMKTAAIPISGMNTTGFIYWTVINQTGSSPNKTVAGAANHSAIWIPGVVVENNYHSALITGSGATSDSLPTLGDMISITGIQGTSILIWGQFVQLAT